MIVTSLIDEPELAGRLLREGKLVAFPTETVYGLGGAIYVAGTVEAIFRAKGRPSDNPLIVHVHRPDAVGAVAANIPRAAHELMEAFWPGPLTLVFPKLEKVPNTVTAGLASVAVRCPGSPVAREILRHCELPVAAPSANRSGRPSATTWQAVWEDLEGRIDAVFQGPMCQMGVESTVVDCTQPHPVLLRSGGITWEQLREVRPDMLELVQASEMVNSPGLRHRHYQPQAEVVLVEKPDQITPDRAYAMLTLKPHPEASLFGSYKQCDSLEDFAVSLFEFFREADRRGLKRIYCQQCDNTGLGRAIIDRLLRASSQEKD